MGTIIISLYRETSFLPREFILFRNYIELFKDQGFRQSTLFTLLFILFAVPLELILGLAFALLLNESLPLRGILRAVILIPWAIPTAISARTWELIYNFNYGLANFIFLKLNMISGPVNWLGTNLGAFTALVIADAWKTTPFVTIIILAGLQAIPKELYEQAKIDRANIFQTFYWITLPLIKPVIIVSLLFRTIDSVRIFDIVYVLTGGGPGGTTSSISLFAFKYFISGDFGYASAASVILFIIAFILSFMYIKLGRFGDDI
ncbi:MAG TPA: sugar ABC transporter permease [Firmicutes bacterium]|nr:sugar ABC transporter permease [Bacillota bacterium]